MLRMKLPLKKQQKKCNQFMQFNSVNDLNESGSKSLLTNVLELNQNCGIIEKNSNFCNLNKIKSKILNDQLTNHSHSNNNNNNNQSNNLCLKCCLSHPKTEPYFVNDFPSLKRNLNQILKEIRAITIKLKKNEDDEEKALTWKFAAMVIDRLCMILFAIATFLSTALILLTSKNFFTPSDPSEKF